MELSQEDKLKGGPTMNNTLPPRRGRSINAGRPMRIPSINPFIKQPDPPHIPYNPPTIIQNKSTTTLSRELVESCQPGDIIPTELQPRGNGLGANFHPTTAIKSVPSTQPSRSCCGKCNKRKNIPGVDCVYCDGCQFWFHGTCIDLSNDDITVLAAPSKTWYCTKCQNAAVSRDSSTSSSQIVTATDIMSTAGPGPDGYFHCPFPSCTSEPFKTYKGRQVHIGKKHRNMTSQTLQNDNSKETFVNQIARLKSTMKVIKRIPSGARALAAHKLTDAIDACIRNNDISSWEKLLLFGFKSFRVPDRPKEQSLTSSVKMNINSCDLPAPQSKRKTKSSTLERRTEAKVADFDIRGAVKILSSNDTLAEVNNATYKQLCEKHPGPSRDLNFPEAPEDNESLVANPLEVKNAIGSFPCGSAGGIDGLLPQHLKDLTSFSTGGAGTKLLNAITNLCNFMLSGQVNPEICKILYGASLCALHKKDGGLRPIAVGNVFRRLAAKIACMSVRDQLGESFRPRQVGFATRGGCEAAIHATRCHVTAPENNGKILLKIDFRNAFNSVERDTILTEVKEKTPLLFPFLNQCYRNPSLLFFGNKTISSQVGAQQGDPAGPLAFSLAIQPIIEELLSEFNIWYLDDGTLCDYVDVVLEDFQRLINKAKSIGLEINPNKCELFFCSGVQDKDVVSRFTNIAPGIRVVDSSDLNLLGAPILEAGFAKHVQTQFENLNYMFTRLTKLKSHYAYHLLKNCFAIPKLTYLMRTFPLWKFPEYVEKVDNAIKETLEHIFNLQLNNKQWLQASLPINSGGIGIRRVQDLALPAFLSSVNSVTELVSQILKKSVDEFQISHMNEALDTWNNFHSGNQPSVPHFQRNWDIINIQSIVENDMQFEDPTESARFLALQAPESGAWLHAIPSPNIGTFMSNQDIRVSIALRLGCNLCRRHTCKCGSEVDEKGRHGLCCTKSAGRFSRHSELNNIIQRSLTSVNVPSTLEPVGLFRSDGKRPDGISLIPWSKGKCLVWDATCVDTLAPTYLESTSSQLGAAASIASQRKMNKYENLLPNNHFVPFAVETLGPFAAEAKRFVNTIGSYLIQQTGDLRSKHYLFQRISLAIQRGNVISIMGTLPSSISMEEVFYL